MGQKIFDSDGTFTVPPGITELSVSMVGGGGSGYRAEEMLDRATGGYCGEFLCNAPLLVTQGQEIVVLVGQGGPAVTAYTSPGNPGQDTSFGSLSVDGAPANSSDGYLGLGDSYTSPCGGIYYDGDINSGYGGQASIYGSGGDGSETINANEGSTGAGGGGVANADGSDKSGAGGNGRVVVDWDDYVEDGGLLINGTMIPEVAADGELHFYCKDQLGNDFDGAVQELMLDGQLVWKEI